MLLLIFLFNKVHFPPKSSFGFLGSLCPPWASPPTWRICSAVASSPRPPLLLCGSDGPVPSGFNQEVVYKSLFKGFWGAGPLIAGHQGSSWALPPLAQVSSAFADHTLGLPSNQGAPFLGSTYLFTFYTSLCESGLFLTVRVVLT